MVDHRHRVIERCGANLLRDLLRRRRMLFVHAPNDKEQDRSEKKKFPH
jgi:hypothetical protein